MPTHFCSNYKKYLHIVHSSDLFLPQPRVDKEEEISLVMHLWWYVVQDLITIAEPSIFDSYVRNDHLAQTNPFPGINWSENQFNIVVVIQFLEIIFAWEKIAITLFDYSSLTCMAQLSYMEMGLSISWAL